MPETAIERWSNRLSYAVRQSGRVAWYAGHGALMRRMVNRLEAQAPERRRRIAPPSRPAPNMRRLLGDVAQLLSRDLANAERGHYPLPEDSDGTLANILARSRAFFRDVPAVAHRHWENNGHEVAETAGTAKRPDYYMQNFHFQSGGWMTEESAHLYDMQVEVLFAGAANAMRRQALVPMAAEFRGRDQRVVAYADIACGPGTFLDQVRRAFPRLPALAIDLSEPYVRQAKRQLAPRPRVQALVAKAEALPLPDASLDLATCIYLFHELPPEVRRQVAAEIARVMRPGGLFVLVDSLQTGNEPDYDGLLEVFPELFHEPYFRGYLTDDLEALFTAAGFTSEGRKNAFLSKVVVLRKPG
jgi:ubiquinone/menaquinone biosynthesis C-methylase UbiE